MESGARSGKEEGAPAAARVGVWVEGFKDPVYAVARYLSYVGLTKEGKPNRFWNTMPDVMTAKCAEALALRKALPYELAGLYSEEEMEQHDNPPRPAVATPKQEVISRPANSPPAQPAKVVGPKPNRGPDWNIVIPYAKGKGVTREALARLLGVANLAEYHETTETATATIDRTLAASAPIDPVMVANEAFDPDAAFDSFESASPPRQVDPDTGEISEGESVETVEHERHRLADEYVVLQHAGQIVNVVRSYAPDFQNGEIGFLRKTVEDYRREIAAKQIKAPVKAGKSS